MQYTPDFIIRSIHLNYSTYIINTIGILLSEHRRSKVRFLYRGRSLNSPRSPANVRGSFMQWSTNSWSHVNALFVQGATAGCTLEHGTPEPHSLATDGALLRLDDSLVGEGVSRLRQKIQVVWRFLKTLIKCSVNLQKFENRVDIL